METINIKKRKKRKTRRCLDELRKKIHIQNDICKENKNTDFKAHKSRSCTKTFNCVTSNRLTLFNKAVRSETVTRLQLPKEYKKASNLSRDIKTINPDCSTNVVPFKPHNNTNKILLENQIENITEDTTDTDNGSPDVNSRRPKSVMLFSPESQVEEACDESDKSLEILILPSSSSSFNNTDNTNEKSNFYDEFMDEMKCYVHKVYPHIFSEEEPSSIKRCKESLINIYLENIDNADSQNVINDNNIPSNEQCSPNVAVIQNPRDYIRYSWSQPLEPKGIEVLVSSPTDNKSPDLICIPSSSPTDNKSDSIHKPYSTSADSMYVPSNRSSDSVFVPSTSPINVVYDSPEYSYYPHRLY